MPSPEIGRLLLAAGVFARRCSLAVFCSRASYLQPKLGHYAPALALVVYLVLTHLTCHLLAGLDSRLRLLQYDLICACTTTLKVQYTLL